MRSALPTAELKDRRVFLRADLNVPLINGAILNDFRLEALQPTLDLLIKKKARIILGTHIGRPQGKDKTLSTKHLLPWFTAAGYTVTWVPTLGEAHAKLTSLKPGTLLLLENLRFSEGERTGNEEYARTLEELADYYVNDAWALLHKKDTSITLLPALFAKVDKTIGLLIERESEELDRLRSPERPFVIIMGGAKVTQKLPYIEKALDRADTLIVLPALAFTLLKAQGKLVGDSLVDDTLLDTAKAILVKAQKKKVRLILPEDYVVGNKDLTGPLEVKKEVPDGKIGIGLGPESLKRCEKIIASAKTVFLNGTMGFFERPETLEPMRKLLQSIAQSNSLSVIGGGESVAAVNLFNLEQDISFCSTGGGATLYYLIHGTLPALHQS